MKTLESIITGRKDYPVFETEDSQKIFDYLMEWEFTTDATLEDDVIITEEDEYRIIEVQHIKFD